jgi:hypothetical protein
MKRFLTLVLALGLLFAVAPSSRAVAAQQSLEVLSRKFYPLHDLTFVDIFNPSFNPVNNIVVNMVIREGTGRNRIVAVGQVFLPAGLVLRPGEHVSATVPIRARVVRDIPALADFEFRVSGNQLDKTAALADVVVEGSTNGVSLEFNRDQDGVPMVFGFVRLSSSSPDNAQATLQGAVLTFYDDNRQVVWSEFMPLTGKLASNDSFMLYGKYEQLTANLVPDISSVDVKIVTGSQQGR